MFEASIVRMRIIPFPANNNNYLKSFQLVVRRSLQKLHAEQFAVANPLSVNQTANSFENNNFCSGCLNVVLFPALVNAGYSNYILKYFWVAIFRKVTVT